MSQRTVSQIAVWRGKDDGIVGFWHHGILCPDGTVIHFTDPNTKFKTFRARIFQTTFQEFRGNNDQDVFEVVYKKSELSPVDTILERARQRLGDQQYNLFKNNCENFAQWCMTGRDESAQIKAYFDNANDGMREEGLWGYLKGLVTAAVFMQVVGPKLVKMEISPDGVALA